MNALFLFSAVFAALVLQTPSPKASAPIDLTGYWVALITDNWRFRMITPPKGDVEYLPLNAEGRRVAQNWDPAKDEASGDQCKGYGPVGVIRLPGRLRITWEDDTTLKLDADNGNQSRILRFATAQPAASAQPTRQGYSIAQWQLPGGAQGRSGPRTGTLKVVTTRMLAGYLHKNGIPYSGNAVLTEYFTTMEDHGLRYMSVTTVLEDPQYLTQSFIRTSLFKKEADGSKWSPTPCSAR